MFGYYPGQKVAWRFSLTGGNYKYKSPLQTAVTNTGVSARFTPMHFDIGPPLGSENWAHGSIRMIWYAPDGSRKRVVDHDMGSEYYYVNGHFRNHRWDDGYCSSEMALEHFDGPGGSAVSL
jgi:hypothetical protein